MLLALLSVTLGSVVAVLPRADDARVLVTVLAVGQLLGHALLGAAGHTHAAAAPGSAVMVAAHVVAVAVGAALIAFGGRLCAAVSRTLAVAAPRPRPPLLPLGPIVVRSADQPLQSSLLLSSSLSHRGPPVGAFR